jgi:hypothetical protein
VGCIVATSTRSQASHSEVLLREASAMLAPLARMLVAHGVTYPQLAQALKPVFLAAARAELSESSRPATDSALSLLSGVHRKDVRALAHGEARTQPVSDRTLSFAAEVFTRWASDRRYTDARGRPLRLPLRGNGRGARSFETLARSVSKDFHPRAVLDELVRLGLAEIDADEVRLKSHAFVPRESFREVAYYIAANVHDHLGAAAANLRRVTTDGHAPFLEHAVYADELSPESAARLQALARQLWSSAIRRWLKAALDAVEKDRAQPAARRAARARFGAYFYAEPPPAPAAKQNSSRRKST